MPLDFEFVSTQFSPLVVPGAPPEMFDKSRIAISPRAIELAEAVIPPHINTLDPINEAE
jgi:hypothetical protein